MSRSTTRSHSASRDARAARADDGVRLFSDRHPLLLAERARPDGPDRRAAASASAGEAGGASRSLADIPGTSPSTGGEEPRADRTIVCVAGVGGSPGEWDAVTPLLGRLAPVAATIPARGSLVLIGHSEGGVRALRIAAAQPGRVDAVVLASAFFPPARAGRSLPAAVVDYGRHRLLYLRDLAGRGRRPRPSRARNRPDGIARAPGPAACSLPPPRRRRSLPRTRHPRRRGPHRADRVCTRCGGCSPDLDGQRAPRHRPPPAPRPAGGVRHRSRGVAWDGAVSELRQSPVPPPALRRPNIGSGHPEPSRTRRSPE